MLYPSYSPLLSGQGSSFGRTIKSPPLIRLKFVNMIQAANGSGSLLGCIGGFNFKPNAAAGYFYTETGELFPKHYNISITFDPQHENMLGWDENKEFLTKQFPYSAPATSTEVLGGTKNDQCEESENKWAEIKSSSMRNSSRCPVVSSTIQMGMTKVIL